MAKLLYRPFGILLAVLAGSLSRRIFRSVWARIDGQHEPPGSQTENTTARRAVAARGVEAATIAMTATAVDRGGRRAFRHLFGFWPGEADPAPRDKA